MRVPYLGISLRKLPELASLLSVVLASPRDGLGLRSTTCPVALVRPTAAGQALSRPACCLGAGPGGATSEPGAWWNPMAGKHRPAQPGRRPVELVDARTKQAHLLTLTAYEAGFDPGVA